MAIVKTFLDNRKRMMLTAPMGNHFLLLRHHLFIKLLDVFSVLTTIAIALAAFTPLGNVLGFSIYTFVLIAVLLIAANIYYVKAGSLTWAGTLLSFIVYLAFAIPAYQFVASANYVTYFLLLLPMLALLILGRTALIITFLISASSVAVLIFMRQQHITANGSIELNPDANTGITIFYISAYFLVIYCCSIYEKMLSLNKSKILQARKDLAKQSQLDPLLNIYSRKAVIRSFDHLRNHKNSFNHKFSIIRIKLNNLKQLNDQQGHNFANDVLKIFAARINFELNDSDIFGRIAGDEFVIIRKTNNSKTLKLFFNKLLRDLCEPISFDGENADITAEAGYCVMSDIKHKLEELIPKIKTQHYPQSANVGDN